MSDDDLICVEGRWVKRDCADYLLKCLAQEKAEKVTIEKAEYERLKRIEKKWLKRNF